MLKKSSDRNIADSAFHLSKVWNMNLTQELREFCDKAAKPKRKKKKKSVFLFLIISVLEIISFLNTIIMAIMQRKVEKDKTVILNFL